MIYCEYGNGKSNKHVLRPLTHRNKQFQFRYTIFSDFKLCCYLTFFQMLLVVILKIVNKTRDRKRIITEYILLFTDKVVKNFCRDGDSIFVLYVIREDTNKMSIEIIKAVKYLFTHL